MSIVSLFCEIHDFFLAKVWVRDASDKGDDKTNIHHKKLVGNSKSLLGGSKCVG